MSGVGLALIAAALIAAFGFMWRRMRPASSNAQVVHSLLSDIRVNQRLLEVMIQGEKVKRFSTTSWKMYRENIFFLNRSVRVAINEVGEIAEAYNKEIKSIKKLETSDYIPNIDMLKMLEQLRRSKSGLEDWLMSTVGTIDPAGGKIGFFDGLLGR